MTTFTADFTTRETLLKDFVPQCADPNMRISLVQVERTGRNAVKLTTQPGDNNLYGSLTSERCDLMHANADGTPRLVSGTQWWAHSVLYPDDFTMPSWHMYNVADFHNSVPGPGQANFMLNFCPQADITLPGYLRLQVCAGNQLNPVTHNVVIREPVRRNFWYDFVYHVKWTSASDGFFDAWLNGKLVMVHKGPTLYPGQSAYFKLANYHAPVCDPSPECIGTHKASSIIHDRVRMGTTRASVED